MNTSINLEIDAINKFILYNVNAMKQWFTLYEDKGWNDTMIINGLDG
jgi:hypothetical protein